MHTSIHNLRYFIVAAGLLLIATVSGDPPAWWTEGDPPVIDSSADSNNHGPANIGQAKWMAKSAIEALRPINLDIASAIELTLVGQDKIIKTLAPPADDSDREKNHAPLLIGQLKAIATPFYDALHDADPVWLETQLTDNETKDAEEITNYYPWTQNPADDQNQAIASIGQLKAVFSLRFQTLTTAPIDSDRDGLSDRWETTHFGNLNTSGSEDTDSDGLDNTQEQNLGTNPRDSDSDDDGELDGADAAPLDFLIDWAIPHVAKYAAIEMPAAVVQQANGQEISCVEMTDDFDVMLNFIPTEYGTIGSSGFWRIGEGTFESIPGASVTYIDTFWGQLTRESTYAVGMAGDSILYDCSGAVDWDFGGALVQPKNGSPFEFWEQLEKQNREGYEAWPVGGDRHGRTVVFQKGDNDIFGGFPHAVWKLFRKADGNIDLSKIATLTMEDQPHFDPECHLSLTKEGWVSVYDQVISLSQGTTLAAPPPGSGDSIWSQDLPRGNKPNGRLLISRANAPSGVYLLNKDREWETPKAFNGKVIVGSTPCGAFLSADHELWTRDRPGPLSQNGTEDWITLKDWAGQHIADLVKDGWNLDLQSTNKHGGMTIELYKKNLTSKTFVLLPVEVVELAPLVMGEDGKEIAGSEIPVTFPESNEMVEVTTLKEQVEQNRIAHREMKVKIPGGKVLAGKKVIWTMRPWGVKENDAIRGDWKHSKVVAHKNCFEESKTYGKYGCKLIDQKSSETIIEAQGEDGFTAVRANLPPIGWNHADIKVKIEGPEAEITIARFVVPAVVVIDAGHGGDKNISRYAKDEHGLDLGASDANHAKGGWWAVTKTVREKKVWVDEKVYPAATGILEKDLTLGYARELRIQLATQHTDTSLPLRRYLTRDSDDNLGGYERARLARDIGADICLALHFNASSDNKTARGSLVCTRTTGNCNLKEDKSLETIIVGPVNDAFKAIDNAERKNTAPFKLGTAVTSDILGFYQDKEYHPIRSTLLEIEFIHCEGGDKLINGTNKEKARKDSMKALAKALIKSQKEFVVEDD